MGVHPYGGVVVGRIGHRAEEEEEEVNRIGGSEASKGKRVGEKGGGGVLGRIKMDMQRSETYWGIRENSRARKGMRRGKGWGRDGWGDVTRK